MFNPAGIRSTSTPQTTPKFSHHLAYRHEAITVIGIELRTTNLDAMHTIPPLCQRFGQDGVQVSIPGKLDGDVLAVYTHFEHAGLAQDLCGGVRALPRQWRHQCLDWVGGKLGA